MDYRGRKVVFLEDAGFFSVNGTDSDEWPKIVIIDFKEEKKIMESLKSVVLECYEEVLRENNIYIAADLNNKVGRESGLDSIGIVNFIINLEEKLDINLDHVLGDIRRSDTIMDIIRIIENLLNDNNQ